MTETPLLPESYWVLADRFLAGEYPGRFDERGTRRRIDALLEAGIDTFVDLTHPEELPPYLPILLEQARTRGRQITHRRFSIQDRGLPGREEMIATLNAIDAALVDGHTIYLHCWGGVGRTGTTVGCYLVRHGKTGREALDQLADWWKGVPKRTIYPRSPETEAQVRFILNWNEA